MEAFETFIVNNMWVGYLLCGIAIATIIAINKPRKK